MRPPPVAAHALKALLRELSPPLLAPLPVEALLGLGRGSAPARELIAALPPVEAAALSWLIDLLARTAAHEPHSRMGARALAVCVAPNLLSLDASGDNPMLALALVTKAAELLHTLIADAGTPLGAAAVSLSPQSPLQEPLHDDDGGTDDELPQPPLAADTASPLAPEVLSPARSPASQPPATGVWSAVTVGSPVVAADSPARA